MPVPSKKRRRPSNATRAPIPSKRKAPPPDEDDEILSDEIDSVPGSPTADVPEPEPADAVDLEPEPENETAEQRRLRLARNYLRHMGISENASDDDAKGDGVVDDDDDGEDADSDSDDDEEGPNDLLRRHALVERGRAVVELADRFGDAATSQRAVTTRAARGHALPPTCVALPADSEHTAVSGGKDSRVVVWDVETRARKATFAPSAGLVARGGAPGTPRPAPLDVDGHVGPVMAVAAAPGSGGALVVSGGRDGLIRVWDVRAGKLARSLRGHRGAVSALAFRAGTRQLFSGGDDRCVKVWDMDEMAYAETLFGHGGEVSAVDSLGKERALSAGCDGTLRLFKLAEESQLVYRRAETMSIDAVAMMSEQRFVSGGDDGAVCLWQMNKRKAVAVAEGAHGTGLGCDAWVSAVAAFRNTDLALSGGGDGCVRLWKCEKVPKLVSVGKIDLGRGFVNGLAVGSSHRVVVAAVGKEHRLGRWSRVSGSKNGMHFVRMPELDS